MRTFPQMHAQGYLVDGALEDIRDGGIFSMNMCWSSQILGQQRVELSDCFEYAIHVNCLHD